MLQRVEAVFPGARSHIEEIEAATPLTHMRYLGHPNGAIYGFEQYTKDSMFFSPAGLHPSRAFSLPAAGPETAGSNPPSRPGRPPPDPLFGNLSRSRRR